MLNIPRLTPNRIAFRSIAVLTSGGDAPGMNAAIRAIVRFGISNRCSVYGVPKGYSGLLEGHFQKMNLSSVANIIQRGGTVLKSDRCTEFYKKTARHHAAQNLRKKGIEGLIVIGGDGSLHAAHLLNKEMRFPTIGIPGTIDNDIFGTDDAIGFDTAVNTALQAIDRIRDTASSHDRLFLVEVMGRSSGFIAAWVGIAGGAETVVIPELKQSISKICKTIDRGIERGKTSSIIAVSEGKNRDTASKVAAQLKARGYSPRVCILGHIQRGGTPTAHDRFLASNLGAAAVAYLLAGKKNAMVGVQNDRVHLIPLRQIIGKKKTFPKETLKLAQILAT